MKVGIIRFPGSNCDEDAWFAVVEHLRERAIIVRHFAKPERISDFLRITVGNPDQCAALIAGIKTILSLAR